MRGLRYGLFEISKLLVGSRDGVIGKSANSIMEVLRLGPL